jgi:hypothetical protein
MQTSSTIVTPEAPINRNEGAAVPCAPRAVALGVTRVLIAIRYHR